MAAKILVVSAHAADFCTRAGGTLIRYAAQGSEVLILVLTFGERGESGSYWKANPGGTLEACKTIRRQEAGAAAECMGVAIEFFDYDDYPLDMGVDRIRDLTRRILEVRPQIVLTHWLEDPLNEDHAITARAVIRAIGGAGMLGALPATPAHFLPDMFLFESTVPNSEFNNFRMDTYIDITSVMDRKLEAIGKFACQPQLIEYYTRFGLHRGFQASEWARRPIKYAEGFRRYNPFVGTTFALTER
jgi:4-oxalomesaconate hydratase